ncbi:MAG: CRISPR-associated endonuclease Cas1 [bacterium]
MKIHKNTVYITTEGTWVQTEGESLQIRLPDGEKRSLPLRNLDSVVLLVWDGVITAEAARRCSESGVSVAIATPTGKFIASVDGYPRGNITLRRAQYRFSDDADKKLSVSKSIVRAKIVSQKNLLARHRRDHQVLTLEEMERQLSRRFEAVLSAQSEEELLGREGDAANIYFQGFPLLIKNPLNVWTGRNRRPPKDPQNAILSFLYSLATNDCKSALALVGLDPYCGIYHHDQPGRPSLALDLVEEFRVRMADQTLLSLLNRNQVGLPDFEVAETGSSEWRLNADGRKKVIQEYQKRKSEEIIHPYLDERVSWGLIPTIQARLLARHIREQDEYMPFHLMASV